MTPADARLRARELLRLVRRGDPGALPVLADVLTYTSQPELGENLALALDGRFWKGPRRGLLIAVREADGNILNALMHAVDALFPERCAPSARQLQAHMERNAGARPGELKHPAVWIREHLMREACRTGSRHAARRALAHVRTTSGGSGVHGSGVHEHVVRTLRSGLFVFDYVRLGSNRNHELPTVIYGPRANRFWIASLGQVADDLQYRYGDGGEPFDHEVRL